jgi:glutaredoxin
LQKAWLSERGIVFDDRNVVEDSEAMDELQELGYFSTPVTLIGDEAVVGFDEERLKELLGLD